MAVPDYASPQRPALRATTIAAGLRRLLGMGRTFPPEPAGSTTCPWPEKTGCAAQVFEPASFSVGREFEFAGAESFLGARSNWGMDYCPMASGADWRAGRLCPF